MFVNAVSPAARFPRPFAARRVLGALSSLFARGRNDSVIVADVPEPIALAAASPHLTAMDVVRPVEAFR